MIKKSENEAKRKKEYGSVCLEILTFDKMDIVTSSQDPLAGNDVTKDDIFG